jgi:hypothetical protein
LPAKHYVGENVGQQFAIADARGIKAKILYRGIECFRVAAVPLFELAKSGDARHESRVPPERQKTIDAIFKVPQPFFDCRHG